MKKLLSALAASALVAASPALAQNAVATPAVADSAEFGGASALEGERGAAFYVLAAVAVALVIWGVWELIDDEELESP